MSRIAKISLERILAQRHGDSSADDPKYKNREARKAWQREYQRKWRKLQAQVENGSQD